MIFDKLRATTAQITRQSKRKAILSLHIELPGGEKLYRLLFTTARMEAGPLRKFPPR